MADSSRPPGLIQRYREELQVRHYARRSVKTYEQWLRRFHAKPGPGGAAVSLQEPAGAGAGARWRGASPYATLTLLPQSLVPALQEHLLQVRSIHRSDLSAGWGRVLMPYALERKYPNASREWGWQWVFPQQKRWCDPATGHQGRHHLDPSVVQKAVKRAVAAAGVSRAGHPHDSGAPRPQGREHHDDLHPRAQPWTAGGVQPR